MILVTGGTGLVGAHLLLRLQEQQKQVRALYRTEQNILKTKELFTFYGKKNLFEKIEWVKGDVTDIPSLEAAFEGITHVYHCAAFISFNPGHEALLHKINIEGTANMVNCALDFGVQKFCHVSSIAALGDTKQGETIITEETEWNAEKKHGDYALTKYGAEMEVWRAWQEGLNVVIVNPGIIFGYGFWENGSGKIFTAVQKGQYFYTKGIGGIIAVEDVVNSMLFLMDNNRNGERFTLVAENISYKKILNVICENMNKKAPLVCAKPWLTDLAWRMDWLFSKLFFTERNFTRAMAKSSHTMEYYDNSKITKAIDYSFMDMETYIADLARKFNLR